MQSVIHFTVQYLKIIIVLFFSLFVPDSIMATIVVANHDDNTVIFLDKKNVATIPVGQGPRELLFDIAKKQLYVSNCGEKSISVLDLTTKKIIGNFYCKYEPRGLAKNNNGEELYVVMKDQACIVFYDLRTMQPMAEVSVPKGPRNIVFDSIKNKLYVTCNEANQIAIIDVSRKILVKTIPTPKAPYGLALDSDKNLLYGTSIHNNSLFSIDTEKMALLFEDWIGNHPTSLAIHRSPGNNRIFVTTMDDDNVIVFDPVSRKTTHKIKTESSPFGLCLLNNSLFVTNNKSNSLQELNLKTLEWVNKYIVGKSPHGISGV